VPCSPQGDHDVARSGGEVLGSTLGEDVVDVVRVQGTDEVGRDIDLEAAFGGGRVIPGPEATSCAGRTYTSARTCRQTGRRGRYRRGCRRPQAFERRGKSDTVQGPRRARGYTAPVGGRGVGFGGLFLVLVVLAWVAARGHAPQVDLAARVPTEEQPDEPDDVPAAGLSAPRREPIAPPKSAEEARPAARHAAGELQPELVTPAQLDAWVRDLLDDDIPGNAGRALELLEAAGALADPWLHQALFSVDEQQRQLAAYLLRERGAAPSEPLLTETLAVLQRGHDDVLGRVTGSSAIGGAMCWLAAQGDRIAPTLRHALGSPDPRQRFLCAFLLACAGDASDPHRVFDELVGHLADNDIEGDALMAAHGLYRMGPSMLPALRAARSRLDAQARKLADLIEENLASPTPRGGRRGARLPEVSTAYVDPVRNYVLGRSPIPQW